MKRKKNTVVQAGVTSAAFILVFTAAASAADGTWTKNATGTQNWSTAGNWASGTVADGANFTAILDDVITANRIITLDFDRIIGNISALDITHNYTIGGTTTLTFDVTSGPSAIDVVSGRQLIFNPKVSGGDGLRLTGPGLVRFNNTNNDYSGGTEIDAGTLFLAATGTAGSGTILLGNTSGSADAELRIGLSGTNITNALEVRAGSSGIKTLANRNTNSVIYSGNITANDNLAILQAGSTGGAVFTVSGAANSIATGKTVNFGISGGGTGRIDDSALWSGSGSISYTSDTTKGFTISGAKTYSGGATLGAMSGTGVLVVQTSSTGPANAPTNGAFGTGTLTLGATKMQAGTSGDITIGNAITFSDNPTFTTAADEKSLIFTGDASLGANRTLKVETGSTEAGTFVEFSGGISGTGFGITKEGAGTLSLTGTNTYTGATTVTSGTLIIDGNITTSSSLTVDSGATLGGTGTVGAAAISGSLAPGNSIGTLTAEGNVTWNANNSWNFELGTPSVDLIGASLGSDNDLLKILGGDFVKGSGTSFTFDFADTGAVGWYKLVDWDGDTTFTDTDFVVSNLGANLDGTFSVDSGTSALYLVVIPEPSAALLGGIGLLALLRRRR